MATKYPIATLADGGTLWSDGSKTYPDYVQVPMAAPTPTPPNYKYGYNSPSTSSYAESYKASQKQYPNLNFAPPKSEKLMDIEKSMFDSRSTNKYPTGSLSQTYSTPMSSSSDYLSTMSTPSVPTVDTSYYDTLSSTLNTATTPNFSDLISSLTSSYSSASMPSFSPVTDNLSLPNAFNPSNFASMLSGQSNATKGVGSTSNPRGYTINSSGDKVYSVGNDVQGFDASKYSTLAGEYESLGSKAKEITDFADSYDNPLRQIEELQDEIYMLQEQAYADTTGTLQPYYDAMIQKAKDRYDYLIGESNAQIPLYEAEAGKDIAWQEDALKRALETGEQTKEKLATKRGTDVKNIYKNKDVSQQKMQNIYSALGTAESSDFLNRANTLEATANTSAADTEQFYGGEEAEVSKKMMDLEKDSNANITNIKDKLAADIGAVRRYSQYTDEEKNNAIMELVAKFAGDMNQLANTFLDSKNQLLASQKNMYEQEYLMQKSADLTKDAYADYIKQAALIPQVSDNDMASMSSPDNSIRQSAAARLSLKYPSLTDLINQVLSGSATPAQLETAITSLASAPFAPSNFASLINPTAYS